MKNVYVDYNYQGDEQEWQQTIVDFINAVEADERLKGEFHYQVFKLPEGRRVHIGRWSSDEVLKTLQSQDFFKQFAGKIKALAGDTLKNELGHEAFSTGE